ncbi:MAG: hypothetical protein ACHQF4_05820 [Sphingobacteriales bacterium]
MKFKFICFLLICVTYSSFGQTFIAGTAVNPLALTKFNISYTGVAKNHLKLESNTRHVEVINPGYQMPDDNSGNLYVMAKESGRLIGYKYNFNLFIQSTIDSVRTFRFNDNNSSLPEVLIYITDITGGAAYYKVFKRLVILDLDKSLVLFDLPYSARYDFGMDPSITWKQRISFAKGKMTIGPPVIKNYLNASQIDKKPLPVGQYLYESDQLTINEKGPNLQQITSFMTEFNSAFLNKNEEKVIQLANFPFYDGEMQKQYSQVEFESFLKNFYYNNDYLNDYIIMMQNAKLNAVVKNNAQRDGEIKFKEVTKVAFLNTLRTKFHLARNAKVFEIDYTYTRTLIGSSHPEQGIYNAFYFGQTLNGYRLCGRGMIF